VAPSPLRGSINQEFALRPNQIILLDQPADGSRFGPSGALNVLLAEAVDERCPSWANCLTPGAAKVTLEVSQQGASSQTFNLCLGLCDFTATFKQSDQVAFSMGSRQYVLHLKGVESEEHPGKPSVIQRVTLLLERK
jgi:hypothetical protein